MAGSSCKVAELEKSGRTSDGVPVPGTNHPNNLPGSWQQRPHPPLLLLFQLPVFPPCGPFFAQWQSMSFIKSSGWLFLLSSNPPTAPGHMTHLPILPSYYHLLQAWPSLKDVALAWPRTFSSHSLVAGSSCSSPAVVYLSTLSCAASPLSHSPLTPALVPSSSCPSCLHLFTIVIFFMI